MVGIWKKDRREALEMLQDGWLQFDRILLIIYDFPLCFFFFGSLFGHFYCLWLHPYLLTVGLRSEFIRLFSYFSIDFTAFRTRSRGARSMSLLMQTSSHLFAVEDASSGSYRHTSLGHRRQGAVGKFGG